MLNRPTAMLPNDSTIKYAHEGIVNLLGLLPQTRICYSFQGTSKSLISTADICDTGREATSSKRVVSTIFNDKITLGGEKYKSSGL